MPHPFFERTTYPWDRRDARELHRALWQAINDPGRIDTFYRGAGPGLLPLAPGAADVLWRQALDALSTAQRLRALCDLLLAEPLLVAVHAALAPVLEAKDPVDQPVFAEDRPFIDRTLLRDKLQRFAVSPSVRVLLIRGASKSGKSWTQYMISDLAQTLGEPCVYLFAGLVATVEDVIDQCFAALGDANGPPPRLETEDAWFKKVCLRLQVLAANAGQTTWIVVDDLGVDENGPRLDPLIRQFLDQFALSMANPAFRRWFRLVLIDYPDLRAEVGGRGVPTKWKEFWDEDRPNANDVDVAAVAEFLLKWAAHKNKQLANADATAFATDIIAAADAPLADGATPVARLQRIHDAVLAAAVNL